MSTVSFFTNEAVSLEKKVDLTENIWRTKLENIDSEYEIDKCVKWIQSNNFQKVTHNFLNHNTQQILYAMVKIHFRYAFNFLIICCQIQVKYV